MTLEDRNVVFDRFYEKSGGKLKSFCLRFVYGHYEFDDIMQTVLIHIYENLHRYDRSKAKLETWAFHIARNKCLDYVRRLGTRNRRIGFVDNLTDYEMHYQTHKNPLDTMVEKEEVGRILAIIEKLDEKKRSIIQMNVFEEMSSRKIAKVLHINRDKVRCITSRTKREIREKLGC
jgi:RNA polymerase sigma factor (sigma-70 family)